MLHRSDVLKMCRCTCIYFCICVGGGIGSGTSSNGDSESGDSMGKIILLRVRVFLLTNSWADLCNAQKKHLSSAQNKVPCKRGSTPDTVGTSNPCAALDFRYPLIVVVRRQADKIRCII